MRDGPERLPQPDFARPFIGGHEHDVHDATPPMARQHADERQHELDRDDAAVIFCASANRGQSALVDRVDHRHLPSSP
jgi:hypothetical protein